MNLQQRLVGCFSTVFPQAPLDQLPSASLATLPQWDSLTSIVLISVIQEEFGTPIDLEDLADLDSFEAVARYIEQRLAAG